jgi:hypothetical protein
MRHHIRAMDPNRGRATGPLGGRPVVVLGAEALAPIARAGAVRADRAASVAVILDVDRTALAAIGTDVDVVIAIAGRATVVEILGVVRRLGGRGIPVVDILGGEQPGLAAASLELLADPGLGDLNVPVPVVEEDELRRALWDRLRAAGVEDRHHPVEVDGRPALAELHSRGLPVADGDLLALAAGAAGVLAGRMAAAARAWTPEASD